MERRKLQEIYDRGDFYFTSRGVPRRKFRPQDTSGVTIDSVWTDIAALNAHDQERLGYLPRLRARVRDLVRRGVCATETEAYRFQARYRFGTESLRRVADTGKTIR